MSTTIDRSATNSHTRIDDPAAIRADILATRERLGDTVEALAAKMDVKAHFSNVKDRALDATRQSAETMRERWIPLTIGAAAVLAVAGGLLARGIRNRRCGN